jgi:UDP-hydrolysing UDP-N-acetyl-D-glucosamine 2-epimerase
MNICVFTGTRAEYGLLRPVMARIQADPDLRLQVLVSGSHLSERHGRTVEEIRTDGFPVSAEVPLPLDDDSPDGVSQAFGEAVQGCSRALERLAPDMLVLLGDRYECLACAVAASLHRVPIAHIHGGEITEGAMDDCFRHAITKLARLHFTSCEAYRHRVIQLGEDPQTVFNVGAPGVENIKTVPLLDRKELEGDLNFVLGDKCLLTTYHPETLDPQGEKHAGAVFVGFNRAMEADPDVRMIITGANADPGGSAIDGLAARFARVWKDRVLVSPSLGLVRYLSAMKQCAAVVGNSSSGIIEAPSFAVPTVNIGDRQKGRARAASVIDVKPEAEAVARAIEQALGPMAGVSKTATNPYEGDGTSESIVREIKQYTGGVAKPFHDLPTPQGNCR